MTGDRQYLQKFGVGSGSMENQSLSSCSAASAFQYVGVVESGLSWLPWKQSSLVQIAMAVSRILRCLFWPSTLAVFSHGLNFLEVIGATLGGRFSTTATQGNGGRIFLCHTEIVQKAVVVCKQELCINSNNN